MSDHPRLTTFWFSDVEGSTRLLAEVGDATFRELLREHRRVVRAAFEHSGGVEVETEGDSFFATFPSPAAAVAAARDVQVALEPGPIRVRIGIHAGMALAEERGYVGLDIHRAARIAGVANGGQTVLSDAARVHVSGDIVDLGEHRLKDLSAPVRLFQVGESRFPPLRTLYRTNLPVPATSFVGREDAFEAITALLGRENVRLVTLTGPGGIGKTRLSLHAAAGVADAFPDGVVWVPMASLENPLHVPATIAQALHVGAVAEATGSAFAERLRDRQLLIVIDNAEHLLPAVADAVALIAAVPGPRLCVTSRERLALPGEHVVPIAGMNDRDSVELFVARARELDPAFADVAELPALCRQLDNLPLAIELAAARTTLFSVGELRERLGRDLDLLRAGRATEGRHRTLQAAIDWSYRLLGDEEQRVFRALATFRGGCSVDALEHAAGADVDTIGSLLDKSLVSRREGAGGARLVMLEMVRRHALELRAADPDREMLNAASAHYFTGLMEQAFARLTSFADDAVHWWGVMRDERDNVRSALAFHEAAGDAASLARLCASEWALWFFIGDASEGARWLRRSMELGPPRRLLSAIENAYSAVLLVSGDHGAAVALATEAVEHARESGDARAEAAALISLGNALTASAATEVAALARWTDAVEAARAVGEDWWEACALSNLAGRFLQTGPRDEAMRLCGELARLDPGGPSAIIHFDLFRAEAAWVEGDAPGAREHLARALEQERRTLFASAYDELELAALIIAAEGRWDEGAVLMAAAAARNADLGLSVPAGWLGRGKALLAELADKLGQERFAAASERGRRQSLQDTIEQALTAIGDD